MISLKEILYNAMDEDKLGLVPYDEWTLPETDQLTDIGFKPNGNYCMGIENPAMLVYRKKDGFHLKDGKSKQEYIFDSFDKMIEYFDKYPQDLKN
jgi:hypothetical protein